MDQAPARGRRSVTIHMEIFRKYDTSTIRKYAIKVGFNERLLYYGLNRYYVNALWEKKGADMGLTLF